MEKRKKMILECGIMAIFMVLSFTACGSGDAAASATEKEEMANAEAVTDEVADVMGEAEGGTVEDVSEQEVTEESVIPASEPVVCEGVDMESTLPGLEWVTTFEGVVDEPKFIVYNDEINKKEIYDPDSTIVFDKYDDTIVVFGPKGTSVGGNGEAYYIYDPFIMSGYGKVKSNTPFFEQEETIEVNVVDRSSMEKEVIRCTIIPVDMDEDEEGAEKAEHKSGTVVYDGIDMESALPGLEWVQTFDGIIDEPKLVLFNDETNKKMIIEQFDEVEFYEGDAIAVYIPKDKGAITAYSYFTDAEMHDNIFILNKLSSETEWGGSSHATCIEVGFDGDRVKLYYYLKLMGE